MGRRSQTKLLSTSYTSLDLKALTQELEKKAAMRSLYMASAWRVVAFFLVVFVVPAVLIALPLYARYTLYPPQHLPLMAGDTTALHTFVSSFWCQGQRMTSNGTFDAYLLPDVPRVSAKRRRARTTTNHVMRVIEDVPETRVTHLLKGSSFTLGACSRWPGGTVIVVKGEENFKRCYYTETLDWEDILEERRRVPTLPPIQLSRRKNRVTEAQPTLQSKTVLETKVSAIENEVNNVDESEKENDGGEVFDNMFDNMFDNSGATNELKSNKRLKIWPENESFENTILPTGIAIDIESPIDNKVISAQTKAKQTSKSQTKSNETNRKKVQQEIENYNGTDEEATESKLSRMLRSILKFDPFDKADKRRRYEADQRMLKLLHSVNDTRDVTAGNSSISSSEEFMENCKPTILYVDLTPLVNCQDTDVAAGAKWSFTVNETSNYYFIFTSDNSIEENIVKFYLEIERLMYDVSGTKDTCPNNTECTFPLKFLGSEAVVVEMVEQEIVMDVKQMHYEESYELYAVCQPRVAVYMVFLLMVPMIILLFAFQ